MTQTDHPGSPYVCERCGEARVTVYVCRDGGRSIPTPDCEHDWQYLERKPGETYTGYCEQCPKCQAIQQIVQ